MLCMHISPTFEFIALNAYAKVITYNCRLSQLENQARIKYYPYKENTWITGEYLDRKRTLGYKKKILSYQVETKRN